MVSASKTGDPTIANDKEIIIATPESPSIVNAELDEVDGNMLSGKIKQIGKIAKVVTGSKNDSKGKSKTMDNAELAAVHQSPARSTADLWYRMKRKNRSHLKTTTARLHEHHGQRCIHNVPWPS